jgi:hypothetical protein
MDGDVMGSLSVSKGKRNRDLTHLFDLHEIIVSDMIYTSHC